MDNLENKNDKKLLSLAPSFEAEDVKRIYGPYIENALEEKEYKDSTECKNKNIAISGGYGAGKSSVIKTYIHNSKYRKKTLFVTLGSYVESESNRENLKEIEISILQQIIYSERPDKLPFSRINRIDKDKRAILNYTTAISILITIIIGFIIGTTKYKENFFVQKSIGLTCLSILLIFVFLSAFGITYYVLSKFNLSKITLGLANVKAEINEHNQISILNEFIDELIYFFLNTDYEIVVFEDLDRLKNYKPIFSKLKEINGIINNSIKNRTIKFIYAVNDTLFENEEYRTKFFDIIIPIIPYSSYQTTSDILISNITSEEKKSISSSDIRRIGSFINNPRSAYDIINEFRIFKENKNDINNNAIRQTFYMAAYKVIYPKRFDLIYKREGIVAYYISPDFKEDLKRKISQNEKNKRENAKNELIEIKNKTINLYTEELIKRLKDKYNGYNIQDITLFDYKKNIITTMKKISNDYDELLKLKDKKIKANLPGWGEIEEEDFFCYLPKEEFFSKLIDENTLEKIEVLNKEIKELEKNDINYNLIKNKEKLDYILNLKLEKESSYFCVNKEEFNKLNEFEKKMITADILNENIIKVISKRHNGLLSENDNNILERIIRNESFEWNQHIDNAKELLDELNADDFTFDSLCIVDLYKEALISKKKEDYIKNIFNGLNEEKIKFIKYLEENNIRFISASKKYIDKYWDEIEKYNFDAEIICFYLKNTIVYANKNDLKRDSFFWGCIENYGEIIEYLEVDFEIVKDKLKDFLLPFSLDVNFNAASKKMMKFIYENDLYEICQQHIEPILEALNYTYNKESILESIDSNKNNKVYEKMKNDIPSTLIYLNINNIRQNDSEEFLIKFIKESKLTKEELIQLLDLENVVFNDISEISSEYYSCLKKKKKYTINWTNLYNLYKANNNVLDEYLINIITSNRDDLANQEFNYDKYGELCDSIMEKDDVDYETCKILNKTFIKSGTYRSIDRFTINKLILQIEEGGICLDDIEELNKVLTNEELSNEQKGRVLVDSFDYFKNLEIENLNEDILKYILKSKLNIQEIIDFMFKNKNSFKHSIVFFIYQEIIHNSVNLSEENVIYLLESDLSSSEKAKIYIKYKEILKDYNIEDILNLIGGDYKRILNKEKFLYFDNTEYNQIFLNILQGNYFDHYTKRGNKLHIAYNPSKRND